MLNKARADSTIFDFDDPNLESPRFPQAISGVDGTIDSGRFIQDGGLRMDLPVWRAPDDNDNVEIFYTHIGTGVWNHLYTQNFPTEPSGALIPILVPRSVIQHGAYEFRYRVRNGDGDFEDFSAAGAANVDLEPPYRTLAPRLVLFPDFLPVDTDITTNMINNNPVFDFTVPAYPDWEAGDRVEYWFTTENPPHDDPLGARPITTGDFVIEVPNTFFDDPAVKDGRYFFVYRLTDAARNVSEFSRTQGRVLKRSSGLLLAPIVVREHTVDGLIDIPEWEAGVTVEIPQYVYASGDQVSVSWGSQTQGPITLTGVFPFAIPVTPQLIVDEYGTRAGPIDTNITYRILRGGGSDSPPLPTTIGVDLSVPGPTPTLPGAVNPLLGEVTIFGPVSTAAPGNYLGADDFTDPGAIQARLTLWTIPAPVAGNIITVYWGSKLIVAGTHTIAEAAGVPITIALDKAAITPAGNGFINVFYTVSVLGSSNGNLSRTTIVEVDDAIEHIMGAATFLHVQTWSVDPRGRLNCASLRPLDTAVPMGNRHIEVQIPPSEEYFEDGRDVEVEFYASTGLAGDMPITGSRDTRTVTLNAATAANGFVFEIEPFVPFLKAAGGFTSPYTSLWLRYSVNISGTWARSVPVVVPARMVTANNYCNGDPLPAP